MKKSQKSEGVMGWFLALDRQSQSFLIVATLYLDYKLAVLSYSC